MKFNYILPLCFMLSIVNQLRSTIDQVPPAQVPAPQENRSLDKAIEFFKAYIYAPSSKLVTSNVLDKLEIKDILKLLDDRIRLSVNEILELNKNAITLYNKDNKDSGIRENIRAIYTDMANIYESLQAVDARVRTLYPEEHMLKLFNVLQKIYAKKYQITYNPEEDKKSFWDVFSGS